MTYARHLNVTPQSHPIPGDRDRMVRNEAGGYTYNVNSKVFFERFLITGAEGGTYYVKPKEHALKNIDNVLALVREDPRYAIDRAVAVSKGRFAPSNSPALFVIALAMSPKFSSNAFIRAYAAKMLPEVARTGTHLFEFVNEVTQMRGWGTLLMNAVSQWYLTKDPNWVAYQVTKYQGRLGWTHRDLLRLAHPETSDPVMAAVFEYIVRGSDTPTYKELEKLMPRIIVGVERIKKATDARQAVGIIREHSLTREMVPGQLLAYPEVWEALIPDMPYGALVRNLGNLSSRKLIPFGSDMFNTVIERLENDIMIEKSGIHPIGILKAIKTYGSGTGYRGSNSWTPASRVVEALNHAFYKSFEFVKPSNKRILIGLDVSGSMSFNAVKGMDGMMSSEAAAAMLMATVNTEPNYDIVAFAGGDWRNAALRPFPVHKGSSLESVMTKARDMTFGATDCALPMIHALENGMQVDAFVIYTDGQTWAGPIHPMQALNRYRMETGISAKLLVSNFYSYDHSIADPLDLGTLDIVGFSSETPKLISNFISGGQPGLAQEEEEED